MMADILQETGTNISQLGICYSDPYFTEIYTYGPMSNLLK